MQHAGCGGGAQKQLGVSKYGAFAMGTGNVGIPGIVRPIHGSYPFALRGRVSPSRHQQKSKNAPSGAFCFSGGEGGIRTLGTLTRTPDFESGTFDHSATSPKGSRGLREPASLRGRFGRNKREGTARKARPGAQPAFFFASRNQVSTTVSGFSESDSMPCSISHSARSG